MIQKILTYSFYLLFALTPLVWLPQTSELFEYNKMLFVYFLTIIILASWIFKMIKTKSLILQSTPLDIPLLIFLGANILSTIFSLDSHISFWGYYSRSNGGLLSLISYLILYWALVSNCDKNQAINFLKSAIIGGVIVSLWAIPEHFGASPSCLILTGNFDTSCWVQDVQARVFATLGQPNWLAAYLVMLIFPAFYFLLTSTKKSFIILNSLFLILFYLAFTFTYSRGATLGLLAGLAIFLFLLFIDSIKGGRKVNISSHFVRTIKPILFIFASFLIISLFFGTALTNSKLLNKFAPPSRPSLITATKPSGTQLENGGTESGQIRLIVWKGALDIFKHYPIFGTGVETFAFAYYQYRPVEHNLISEWDFLYNKAHNEFLNYLATTGIIGFLSYLSILSIFIIWSIKKVIKFNSSFLLLVAILASYISYLVQNFFGFSVVITALFFYLFPALAFLATDSTKQFSFPIKNLFSHTQIAKIIVLIIAGLLLITLAKNFLADTYYTQGLRYNDVSPGKAYNKFAVASNLNSGEPLY
ncbi:MAG: O-antigen ligase family protein, partial [Candidatus Daviesbacteria bacterium]|nr:O-antigen ligase family protein [Candidatus Daviesbacteria bacterium]